MLSALEGDFKTGGNATKIENTQTTDLPFPEHEVLASIVCSYNTMTESGKVYFNSA